MKKRILISIVALSAFSCDITNKKATLSATSIYFNFETGENEWYLTNPEDSVVAESSVIGQRMRQTYIM